MLNVLKVSMFRVIDKDPTGKVEWKVRELIKAADWEEAIQKEQIPKSFWPPRL